MTSTIQSPRLPGSTLHVKGDIISRENLEVHGTIEGTVTLEECELTAGVNAHVLAAVSAKVVTVYGHLKGHITADVVDIAPGATVEASVVARQFALDEDALFNGSVNTERAHAASNVARYKSRQGP